MAVTAKFLADFTSFEKAVQEATAQMKGFETEAHKVSSALNKMGDSFSGKKVIQEATLMTKAYQDLANQGIGLTESEARKMNATLSEAIAKYRVMGEEAKKAVGADVVAQWEKLADVTGKIAKTDAPAGIQKITAATKTAHQETASWGASLTKIAGSLGIAFSVGAVVNFGKKVFEAAGEINDMATKLGISTDAVQGFKFAAEQTGSSLDSVSTAINKMNVNLAGGDKATVKALQDAGLEFSNIRQLKPEDAFLAITDAIQKIPDPMRQADIAMQLFGKGAADLLPGMKEGFRQLSDSADKMSAETIKSLEEAGDAWQKLSNRVVIISGNIIASVSNTVEQTTSSWKEFLQFAGEALAQGTATAVALAEARRVASLPPEASPFRTAPSQTRPGVKVGPDVNLSAKPSKFLSADEQKAHEDAMRRSAAAADQWRNSLDALIKTWTGANLATEVRRVAEAHDKLLASGFPTMGALRKVGEAAVDLQKKGALLTPELFALSVETGAWGDSLPKVEDGIRGLTSIGPDLTRVTQMQAQAFADANKVVNSLTYDMNGLGSEWNRMVNVAKPIPPKVKEITVDFGDLSRALSQLAQVSGGSFSAVVQGLASITGGLDAAKKGVETFKSGLSAFKGGDILSGITGMASGITGIVSAAVAATQAIKALWGAFDRNKGRDLVKEFAESFGGFDALQKEIDAMGEAGAGLWVKLTQGVGRNNPEQAQRVIAEVEEAMARYKAAQESSTVATEEGAQATIESASQAALALDELNGRLQVNSEAWGAWSEDVTGFLQKLADDIRNMPLPGPYGPEGSSGTGTVANPGATFHGPGSGGSASSDTGGVEAAAYAPTTINIDGEMAWSGLIKVAKKRGWTE